MTPEQISIITTIAFILDKIGTWPIGTIVLVLVIGPWIATGIFAWGQHKRFESVKRMYENNADLVKDYRGMTENFQELIILNTQAMQGVVDRIDKNLFCPMHKQQTQKTEVSG